jgi:hypothetical protein
MDLKAVARCCWEVASKTARYAEKAFRFPSIAGFVLLLLPLVIFTIPAFAQTESASISGTVTDHQGGLVPDAQIEIVNTDTNVTFATKTNKAGVYNAPSLKPGHYRMLISKEGFKQIDLRDITLNVQDSVNRNFALDLGGTSETIIVRADQCKYDGRDGEHRG